jgi:very-short-patch-repair endonuclease
VATGRSAALVYRLEGVSQVRPTIAVPYALAPRHSSVDVTRCRATDHLMVRTHRGMRVTGPESTLRRLGATLDAEPLEVACEDARRRQFTSVPALRAYLGRYNSRGHDGTAALRALVDELDPRQPSRSTLEVKTRRLIAAARLPRFEREYPLIWDGRTRYFDFAREREHLVLECNGRRWHDDATDYEDDHDKWSIPGRIGWRIIFATWDKVTRRPDDLVAEIRAALSGR